MIYEAWRIKESDFPIEGTTKEQLQFMLGYGILAPSPLNTQPWQFCLEDNQLVLFLDDSRNLPTLDPRQRKSIISCGSACHHIEIAMSYFGHQPQVSLLPEKAEPDLLAKIVVGPRQTPSDIVNELFPAITQRRSYYQHFNAQTVPATLISKLQHGCQEYDCELQFADLDFERHRMVDIAISAIADYVENKLARHELANWVRPPLSKHRDGIPSQRLEARKWHVRSSIRNNNWANTHTEKSASLMSSPTTLGILTTTDDSRQSWLQAGRALSHCLLQASAEEVHASYFNAAIDLPHYCEQIKLLLNDKRQPQIIFRLGYAEDAKPSPRRKLEEILL